MSGRIRADKLVDHDPKLGIADLTVDTMRGEVTKAMRNSIETYATPSAARAVLMSVGSCTSDEAMQVIKSLQRNAKSSCRMGNLHG